MKLLLTNVICTHKKILSGATWSFFYRQIQRRMHKKRQVLSYILNVPQRTDVAAWFTVVVLPICSQCVQTHTVRLKVIVVGVVVFDNVCSIEAFGRSISKGNMLHANVSNVLYMVECGKTESAKSQLVIAIQLFLKCERSLMSVIACLSLDSFNFFVQNIQWIFPRFFRCGIVFGVFQIIPFAAVLNVFLCVCVSV